MTTLSPADLLNLLHAHLEDWVAAKRGRLSIAADAFHVLELLAESPAGFRVILAWAGDDNAGGDLDDGVVNNHIEVIVTQNRGLSAKPGSNLVEGRAGQEPLFVLVSQVRARCRSIAFEEEATFGVLEYQGCEPVVSPDGIPLDAFKLKFNLLAAIPHETE